MSLVDRVRRLERNCLPTEDGWELDEAWPPKIDLDADGPWAKLKGIRDNHPDPAVRNMSLMDMAEDLIPGFKQRVREGAEAYKVSREWRWMDGRCYVRERPGFRRGRNSP